MAKLLLPSILAPPVLQLPDPEIDRGPPSSRMSESFRREEPPEEIYKYRSDRNYKQQSGENCSRQPPYTYKFELIPRSSDSDE